MLSERYLDPFLNAFLVQPFYAPDCSDTGEGGRNLPSFRSFLGDFVSPRSPRSAAAELLLAFSHLIPWEAKESIFRVGFVAEFLICSVGSLERRRDPWIREQARRQP